MLNSNDTARTRKLGEQGYLADAVRGINDQLAETQFAARVVVVRTAEGNDPDDAIALQQTISNIAGDSTQGTGSGPLSSRRRSSAARHDLMAPGYTSQIERRWHHHPHGSRTTYVMDHVYPVTFTGGGPEAVQAQGYARGLSNGSLGAIELEPRCVYDTPPTITAPPSGWEVDAAAVGTGGIGYAVGEQLLLPNDVILEVATVVPAGGPVLTATVVSKGFLIGTEEAPTVPEEPLSSTALAQARRSP